MQNVSGGAWRTEEYFWEGRVRGYSGAEKAVEGYYLHM